jgi:hypothetical protein
MEQLHAPAILSPGKSPRYQLDKKLGLDDVDRRKIFPHRYSNSDPSAIDCAIPAPIRLHGAVIN